MRDSKDPDTSPDTPREAGATADARSTTAESPAFVPDSGAPSGERASRKGRRDKRDKTEDTLLSLPAPAPTFEVEIDDRVTDLEHRYDDILDRVRQLEQKPPPEIHVEAEPAPSPQPRWLVWVVFLLALALAWQMFARSK
jgi:hypothetical protein